MDEESRERGSENEDDGEAVNEKQRAALQAEGRDLGEEEEETGEGILDHREHSDAPGPFGTA